MPYDKGDFTQQGINGDVSALMRLNEKRVMKVVLSSDDESDNCDISGKVYDLLNGTEYDIGSGGGGGGDFATCTATVILTNDRASYFDGFCSQIINDELVYTPLNGGDGGSTLTTEIVLYKGSQSFPLYSDTLVSATGDASYDSDTEMMTITGDCTLTLKQYMNY